MKKLKKGALVAAFAAAAISLSACKPALMWWEASAHNAMNRAGYAYNAGELVSREEFKYTDPRQQGRVVDAERLTYETTDRGGRPVTVTVNCYDGYNNGIVCSVLKP